MADYGTPPTGYGGYGGGGEGGIDPNLLMSLMAGSAGSEDQSNLQQQMKMAEALRGGGIPHPYDTTGGRTGLAVTPRTPIAAAMTGLTNVLSMQQQKKALDSMRANAEQLRKMRGLYMQQLIQNQGGPQGASPASADPYGNQGAAAAMQAANAPIST